MTDEQREQEIRELYSSKPEHYGGGFGDEVRFLLSQLDAARQQLAAIEEQAPPTPEEWHKVNDALDASEKREQRLREALQQYVQRGHHDTCSHALSIEYPCDCGFKAGKAALADGAIPPR